MRWTFHDSIVKKTGCVESVVRLQWSSGLCCWAFNSAVQLQGQGGRPSGENQAASFGFSQSWEWAKEKGSGVK